jgi:hypothetical protein
MRTSNVFRRAIRVRLCSLCDAVERGVRPSPGITWLATPTIRIGCAAARLVGGDGAWSHWFKLGTVSGKCARQATGSLGFPRTRRLGYGALSFIHRVHQWTGRRRRSVACKRALDVSRRYTRPKGTHRIPHGRPRSVFGTCPECFSRSGRLYERLRRTKRTPSVQLPHMIRSPWTDGSTRHRRTGQPAALRQRRLVPPR